MIFAGLDSKFPELTPLVGISSRSGILNLRENWIVRGFFRSLLDADGISATIDTLVDRLLDGD